jgi:hypothetical protein
MSAHLAKETKGMIVIKSIKQKDRIQNFGIFSPKLSLRSRKPRARRIVLLGPLSLRKDFKKMNFKTLMDLL